jgi:hypothetical protein
MKVSHKNYQPPTIYLSFSGRCLKFSHNKDYACNSE